MRVLLLLLLLLLCLLSSIHASPLPPNASSSSSSRERFLMDFDWKFHLGDFTDRTPVIQLSYDDSSWRSLNLPHDMVIEGTFSKSADMAHGCERNPFLFFHFVSYCTHVSLFTHTHTQISSVSNRVVS